MNSVKQNGFSIVELLVVVVVAAAVGFAGYTVYHRHYSTQQSAIPKQSPTATNIPTAPAITNTSSLDTAATTLDQTDPAATNTSDTSQLDSQLSAF